MIDLSKKQCTAEILRCIVFAVYQIKALAIAQVAWGEALILPYR